MWFPKVCRYGKYSGNLGGVDRSPDYYPKHLVITFFCWLQQQSTKFTIPAPPYRQRHCYAANGSQKKLPYCPKSLPAGHAALLLLSSGKDGMGQDRMGQR